jgi:hypothetical protein
MRRRIVLMFSAALVAVVAAASGAAPASAYGGGAAHDMWQVGLSINCNNPDFCGQELGGFWGWAEFDRSADGSQTWGDVEAAGCAHVVGGGGPFMSGAGHVSIEVESWTIGAGSAGPETFIISGEETDSFGGTKTTFDFTDFDTEISAVPGHYSTSDILGLSAPGVAFQTQVAFRPAK